jgi:hypothetical protein
MWSSAVAIPTILTRDSRRGCSSSFVFCYITVTALVDQIVILFLEDSELKRTANLNQSESDNARADYSQMYDAENESPLRDVQ